MLTNFKIVTNNKMHNLQICSCSSSEKVVKQMQNLCIQSFFNKNTLPSCIEFHSAEKISFPNIMKTESLVLHFHINKTELNEGKWREHQSALLDWEKPFSPIKKTIIFVLFLRFSPKYSNEINDLARKSTHFFSFLIKSSTHEEIHGLKCSFQASRSTQANLCIPTGMAFFLK